jgi:hypothetical protein
LDWWSSPLLFPLFLFPFLLFPLFFHFRAPRALSEEIMALFKVTDQILREAFKGALL